MGCDPSLSADEPRDAAAAAQNGPTIYPEPEPSLKPTYPAPEPRVQPTYPAPQPTLQPIFPAPEPLRQERSIEAKEHAKNIRQLHQTLFESIRERISDFRNKVKNT